jgi:hypothetical protein
MDAAQGEERATSRHNSTHAPPPGVNAPYSFRVFCHILDGEDSLPVSQHVEQLE